MATLTLVDPQKMETLPLKGRVFLDYQYYATPAHKIEAVDVDTVHSHRFDNDYTFHAWSRTATFGEGTDGTE